MMISRKQMRHFFFNHLVIILHFYSIRLRYPPGIVTLLLGGTGDTGIWHWELEESSTGRRHFFCNTDIMHICHALVVVMFFSDARKIQKKLPRSWQASIQDTFRALSIVAGDF